MKTAIRIIALLLIVAALAIAFLFALNGRYIKMDERCVFDKWTQETVWRAEYTRRR